MVKITINGVTFDPAADYGVLQQHVLLSAAASKSNYILIQVSKPLTLGERKLLEAQQAELLEFVPQDTYIARFKPADLSGIRSLPFVTWANTYLHGFKIAPELHQAATGPTAQLSDLTGPPAAPNSGACLVNIVLQKGADEAAAIAAIAAASGVDQGDLKPSKGKFRVRVASDRLPAIAAIDDVRHVEQVYEKHLWNNVARGVLGADPVRSGVTLQGSGQIVAVCDTGFDNGDAANPHPAFAGRVLKLYALARNGDASDRDGHGTHVCGSVLGDGVSAADGQIQGTAPKAQLVMQSVANAQGYLTGIPSDISELFQPAYDEGARVHSNSWGDNDNGYPSDSQGIDDFVWTHRDMVIVIAAGNGGKDGQSTGTVDPNSVGSPGTAKNCITVGACENNRPTFVWVDGQYRLRTYGDAWSTSFPAPPINGDLFADNPDGLAAFSSRGPTADGRIKPDVVAPGTAILSTRSRATGVGPGWGPSGDALYFYDGGTSMATPLVAGCAAVLREYLTSQKPGSTPSAALVKALLINGADSLKGQYTPIELGVIPNRNEGFGRVDLPASVDAKLYSHILAMWDEDQTLEVGQSASFAVDIPNPMSLVKVTLVWTDPAGEGLQNDLDLVVTTPNGVTAYGNAQPGSTVPDRLNNVEQVSLTTVPAGKLTLSVQAYRIALQAQSFAVVIRAVDAP